MARELAIVLVNGSTNSTVACALAGQRHRPVLLRIDAGEGDEARSVRRFDALVAHAKPYRSMRITLPAVRSGDARLLNNTSTAAAVMDGWPTRLTEQLPMMAIALRLAAQLGATALYTGHRTGPDAAALARVTEYGQIWGELLQATCDQPTLEISMPLLELEAWQVIDLAMQVNAPLHLSWDCAHDADVPCGACAGCQARDAAFQRSGRPDPLKPMTPARR